MNDRVRITLTEPGIAEVCLTRGDKLNALDFEMFDALAGAIDRLRDEPGLRVVLLHGEGRGFCAGLDMQRMSRIGAGEPGGVRDLRPRTHGAMNSAQYIAGGWRTLPVPVIAAVHGMAFGGGLQVALGADLRLIDAETKMSVMEVKWGLVPDMAGIVLMRGLLRDDVARELTFSGRIVQGDEAVRLGLATRVCTDPLAEARALAAELAQRSPDALRAAKRLLNQAARGDSDAVLFQAESDEQVALMGAPNQTEAVRANLERRPPEFKV
ncbi:crotonase/enoyl-CoA hydratase family protein [Aquincola sp. S2]|uniref:Crotonase/enoyl-CoA hydratase family protein n=1 Tax=Pseudaquabacterium terrae TaxID=2732868 RepID=A0ABX2EFM7_9BURK|nr:crotonase/enoyl-CoA hydratase family protein [Aquabacterium terrae]NRF67439.1 crotonase/enoyl-CoA hydratase family protein [Aquabacterium terrae]